MTATLEAPADEVQTGSLAGNGHAFLPGNKSFSVRILTDHEDGSLTVITVPPRMIESARGVPGLLSAPIMPLPPTGGCASCGAQ